MSVLPLLDDPFGNKFEKVFEDVFGHELHPEQIYHSLDTRQSSMMHSNLLPDIYHRQHCVPKRNPRQATDLIKSRIDKHGFKLCMDVHRFQPNELTVKTVNNSIVVEGKHEVKEDEHGHIYRHFVRRYELPKQCDVKDVVSSLSSDGILTIKAPPKSQANESNEREIQIQYTGPAHLSIKPIKKTEK